MKKILPIAVAAILLGGVFGMPQAHEREGLPNLDNGLIVSLSANLGEQVVLYLRPGRRPAGVSPGGGLNNEMWATIVDVDAEPLPCNGPVFCPAEVKLDLPDSGFLKISLSLEPNPDGTTGSYYLTMLAGNDGTAAAVPITIGELKADALGRVAFEFIPKVKLEAIQNPGALQWVEIEGAIASSEGGTRGQLARNAYGLLGAGSVVFE